MPEHEEESSLNVNEVLAQLVRFVARRRWWILLPFPCIALGTIGVLSFVPNRYTSTATLLVVQQQVPQRYVVPNSETDVTSALQAMKQETLSRTQLLRMIDEFGLYPKKRGRLAPEQLVTLMQGDIDIVPIIETPSTRQKDFDAFRISFTTEKADVAQQVTTTLTSLFMSEYLRSGTEHAVNTTNFLRRQVEEKGKELEIQEARLRDFKLRYVGELPEQQQGNLGILTGLQGQLQNTTAALNRAQQQRALLQAQLAATPKKLGILASIPGGTDSARALNPLDTARTDLARLQSQKATLKALGYTALHPDVVRNQREIAQAEEALKNLMETAIAEEKARPAKDSSGPPSSLEVAEDPALAQLKSNLEANRMEIESLTTDEGRLKASITQYETRINQTPVREQEEAGIVRDTEALRQEYAELLKKEQESQLATNLEKQQGGQQFRLIDSASLPSVPSSPKRVKISLGGAAGGLVLGIALAFLMEMRDTSFHTEKEITKLLGPPFVLGIPLLPTAVEARNRKWSNAAQWAAASVIVTVVVAAELYVFGRAS